jgi:hypothetical protein
MEKINSAMHEACKEAGCVPNRVFKPKPFWCPELSRLRDRKRFWWNMWVQNGRPRSGVVFDCWKGVKKLFRQASRRNVHRLLDLKYEKLNNLYNNRKMGAFWNFIEKKQRRKTISALYTQQFADFYSNIMQDKGVLSNEHINVSDTVKAHYDVVSSGQYDCQVQPDRIKDIILSLGKGCSVGCDGVSTEHLVFGMSDVLCDHMANLYTNILTTCIVPHVFTLGIIIPILKKSTLNPNCPSNYRPITLSSVHSKIVECLIVPEDNVCNTQFGFRKGKGTAFGCSLLNDITAEFNVKESPLFMCSLDAEKCFDSIWHDALFFKLKNAVADSTWLLLYNWYKKN